MPGFVQGKFRIQGNLDANLDANLVQIRNLHGHLCLVVCACGVQGCAARAVCFASSFGWLELLEEATEALLRRF